MIYKLFPQLILSGYLRMDRDQRRHSGLSTALMRFRYIFHIAFHILDPGLVTGFSGA